MIDVVDFIHQEMMVNIAERYSLVFAPFIQSFIEESPSDTFKSINLKFLPSFPGHLRGRTDPDRSMR